MRKLSVALTALMLLLLSASFTTTKAQTAANAPLSREPYGIDRYLNIRSAASPTLSPKGDRLAFLTRITGTNQVWMMDAAGGNGWPEQMTFYTDNVDFVRWSPDGNGLIFAKARSGDENAQLYWLSADGSQIKALTDAPKVRHNFGGWSHNGRLISYSSNKRNKDFFDVYVMEVTTGDEQLVYKQDGSNDAVAWSFNDFQLVVSHGGEQLSLDNDLLLVDLVTKAVTPLTTHQGASQFGDVHFTRDGRALILGSDDKREFNSLTRMDLATKRTEVIDDTQWDLSDTEMSDDGRLFAYTINRDGFSELFVREIGADGSFKAKGQAIALPGKGIVSGLEFSKDNRRLAFVFNGARYNADVWFYDVARKTLTQATHSTRAAIPQASFIEPELIRYKTFDGRDVPAWYYKPQINVVTKTGPHALSGTMNATSGLPVIVSVHGGPEGQEQPGFNAIYQYFLARGYAILATNVRGSTGYGKTYTHLDDVRKREDSVKDLAAAVDWLKTEGGADPARIAVMGGSYGGYMTLAAITLYPELWAAAVDTVGIANFESFMTNTSSYRRKLREVEYGSLANDRQFLRDISPLNRVERIKTPLMVIAGKNDPRVPYTEAEQIVGALKTRNSPVEYKLFDDEGHGVSKLSNRLIVYPLVADFLDRYMKKASSPTSQIQSQR
jgi:dipeptidyl aminopeptidase/acylaminoacyl peptidase